MPCPDPFDPFIHELKEDRRQSSGYRITAKRGVAIKQRKFSTMRSGDLIRALRSFATSGPEVENLRVGWGGRILTLFGLGGRHKRECVHFFA